MKLNQVEALKIANVWCQPRPLLCKSLSVTCELHVTASGRTNERRQTKAGGGQREGRLVTKEVVLYSSYLHNNCFSWRAESRLLAVTRMAQPISTLSSNDLLQTRQLFVSAGTILCKFACSRRYASAKDFHLLATQHAEGYLGYCTARVCFL